MIVYDRTAQQTSNSVIILVRRNPQEESNEVIGRFSSLPELYSRIPRVEGRFSLCQEYLLCTAHLSGGFLPLLTPEGNWMFSSLPFICLDF